MNEAKQVSETELERLREQILEAGIRAKKLRAAKQFLSLILEVAGYMILIFVDWRVALAVFLLQWAFQIKVVR